MGTIGQAIRKALSYNSEIIGGNHSAPFGLPLVIEGPDDREGCFTTSLENIGLTGGVMPIIEGIEIFLCLSAIAFVSDNIVCLGLADEFPVLLDRVFGVFLF